jgi:hypothetical protein
VVEDADPARARPPIEAAVVSSEPDLPPPQPHNAASTTSAGTALLFNVMACIPVPVRVFEQTWLAADSRAMTIFLAAFDQPGRGLRRCAANGTGTNNGHVHVDTSQYRKLVT